GPWPGLPAFCGLCRGYKAGLSSRARGSQDRGHDQPRPTARTPGEPGPGARLRWRGRLLGHGTGDGAGAGGLLAWIRGARPRRRGGPTWRPAAAGLPATPADGARAEAPRHRLAWRRLRLSPADDLGAADGRPGARVGGARDPAAGDRRLRRAAAARAPLDRLLAHRRGWQ